MNDAHIRALDEVIANVVAPGATQVDRDGTFPAKAIATLGEAGILGLTVPAAAGGGGGGVREATEVIEALARACGSTAMVVMMHYAATAVLVPHAPAGLLADIAAGRHLSTLAFSEAGSRSHFWAPLGSARADGDEVALTAFKSMVTSAEEADSYVWSSLPLGGGPGMTMWLVPATTPGLVSPGRFDGLGLRGNASKPIRADGARVPRDAMIGADATGLDVAMETILPYFLLMSASFSVGLAEAAFAEAVGHLRSARLEHLGQTLADVPLVRHDIGRMRIKIDSARAVLADAITALQTRREDEMLRLLEVKAVAAEMAIEVTDLAMKACGGAAFRKDLGLERRFRDARAARVMAPTTDKLIEFIARAVCGQPLLDQP